MKQGHLSEYFSGVAIKYLSAVEADVLISHQHEFNGVEALKRVFGSAQGKQSYPAKFVYLSDRDDEPVLANGFLTWYDARERHPTRSEHRLYFPTTAVSELASAGDLLVIGLRPDGSVLVVVAEGDSTVANQVRWLFGAKDLGQAEYLIRENPETEHDRIAFASRFILEAIGVVIEPSSDMLLEDMLQRFRGAFPSTREFSTYARSTLHEARPTDNGDTILMAWMEREEALFRTLERHLISDRLTVGFDGDVDAFISFSLSVQNRRKSRVGFALENHLEYLFAQRGLRFSRTGVTENKSKPDFLFPGVQQYHDMTFDSAMLTVLGVKTTCKDRWRQVLAEADRVERKHLLTLEASISANQTDEMRTKNLQLVLPAELHQTYQPEQQTWLKSVEEFLTHVGSRQIHQ
jgi:hypothetical protein